MMFTLCLRELKAVADTGQSEGKIPDFLIHTGDMGFPDIICLVVSKTRFLYIVDLYWARRMVVLLRYQKNINFANLIANTQSIILGCDVNQYPIKRSLILINSIFLLGLIHH